MPRIQCLHPRTHKIRIPWLSPGGWLGYEVCNTCGMYVAGTCRYCGLSIRRATEPGPAWLRTNPGLCHPSAPSGHCDLYLPDPPD